MERIPWKAGVRSPEEDRAGLLDPVAQSQTARGHRPLPQAP